MFFLSKNLWLFCDNFVKSMWNLGKDAETIRRQRHENTIELRKNKREDTLNKKRNFETRSDFDDFEEHESDEARLKPNLQDIVNNAQSPNPEVQLNAIQCMF